MSQDVMIQLKNVSKTFHVREGDGSSLQSRVFSFFSRKKQRQIKAVQSVNFEVKRGEFVGIIGRNGSGKSTLVHLMTGAYEADPGGIRNINGTYIRLSLGLGFNQQLSARQNVILNASILGMPLKEIREKFDSIIDFAELEDFTETKLKFFSKGMKARLAFSIAMHTNTEILLMDEFFGGVGDENFKKKADKVFKETVLSGRTIIHVSHNLKTIQQYCKRVILIEKGKIVKDGSPEEVIPIYREILKDIRERRSSNNAV
jgi:ABC-type polysaccharide/polyol phosphate transport system ATPase subunit